MLYAIHAQVITHDGAWEGSKSAPLFYLDSIVSGIITEADAVRVARHVIDPLGLLADKDIHVSAVQVVLDQSPPPATGFHVEDNVTRVRASRDFLAYASAAETCQALNLQGPGGRYGVYDAAGHRADVPDAGQGVQVGNGNVQHNRFTR